MTFFYRFQNEWLTTHWLKTYHSLQGVYLDTVNDAAITNIKWVHDEHEDDCLNQSLAHIAKQKCYEQHL